MAQKSSRTGIVLLIVFALGLAAWTYLAPSDSPVAGATMVGGAQRGAGQTPVRDGGGQGFKGSDEELQAVTGNR